MAIVGFDLMEIRVKKLDLEFQGQNFLFLFSALYSTRREGETFFKEGSNSFLGKWQESFSII